MQGKVQVKILQAAERSVSFAFRQAMEIAAMLAAVFMPMMFLSDSVSPAVIAVVEILVIALLQEIGQTPTTGSLFGGSEESLEWNAIRILKICDPFGVRSSAH